MRALGGQRAHRLWERVKQKAPASATKEGLKRERSSHERSPSIDDTATGCDEASGRAVFTPHA
jgi:hypothetical protein